MDGGIWKDIPSLPGWSIWILSDVDVTLRFFRVELSRSLQRSGNMVRMKLMHSSTLYGLPLPSPNLAVMFHIRWRTSMRPPILKDSLSCRSRSGYTARCFSVRKRVFVRRVLLSGHLTASQSYEYDWLPGIYWLTWKSIHGEIWKKRRWNLKEATVKIGVITVKAPNNIIDRKVSDISLGKIHCTNLLSRGFLPMDLLQNLNPSHRVKLYACSH